MASKVLILVLVLIGSECVSLKSVNENLILPPEKQREDAEIHKILFGETPKIHECLKTNETLKQKSRKNATEPLFTVVILQEIMFQNKKLHIQQCTGSLIHPQVVLTAAHCLYRKSLENLKVRAGECKRLPKMNSTYYQERPIESIEVLPNYDPTMPQQDIALVFLKEPFRIVDNVNTICLPPSGIHLDLDYARCFATGWERKPKILPGYENFRKTNMTVIPNENCERALQLTALGEDVTLDNNFICASGEFNKTVLDTNGGAPLACSICGDTDHIIQVGVMSWGFKNAPLPEVFTSITSSHAWIRARLNERGLKLFGCETRWTLMHIALPQLRP